jgi:hypothetical protein
LKALGSISVMFDSRREVCVREGRGGGGDNCTCSTVSGSNECSLPTASCGGGGGSELVGSAVEESVVSSTDVVVILAFMEDDSVSKNGNRPSWSQL